MLPRRALAKFSSSSSSGGGRHVDEARKQRMSERCSSKRGRAFAVDDAHNDKRRRDRVRRRSLMRYFLRAAKLSGDNKRAHTSRMQRTRTLKSAHAAHLGGDGSPLQCAPNVVAAECAATPASKRTDDRCRASFARRAPASGGNKDFWACARLLAERKKTATPPLPFFQLDQSTRPRLSQNYAE